MIWLITASEPYEGMSVYSEINFDGTSKELADAFTRIGTKLKDLYPEILGGHTPYRAGYGNAVGFYHKGVQYDLKDIYAEEGITSADVAYFDVYDDANGNI